MNGRSQKLPSSNFARAGALVVALALLLAALLGMIWMLRDGIAGWLYSPGVATFDSTVFERLHQSASASELQVFVVLTAFGSPVAMTILALLGAVWLAVKSRMTVVAAWIAALAGSSGLSVGIKHIFARQRPPGALEYLTGGSYSFPSTHALCSTVGYGMVAFVFCRFFARTSRSRVIASILSGAAILTIAVSRLVLGVHYASDVSVGVVAGALWLFACICALEWAERGEMPPS